MVKVLSGSECKSRTKRCKRRLTVRPACKRPARSWKSRLTVRPRVQPAGEIMEKSFDDLNPEREPTAQKNGEERPRSGPFDAHPTDPDAIDAAVPRKWALLMKRGEASCDG